MTSGEKLFFFIFALPFLVANTVPLEFSIVPKTNCHDLNGNGFPDFMALSSSDLPRTIYYVELLPTKTEIRWEFTMPEERRGYFVDMILDDFDNNGRNELIVTAYQDEETDIFYIFSVDAMGFYSDSPTITGLQKTSSLINNPQKLYPLKADNNGRSMFLLTQGSPNRRVIMCEFLDNEITARGSLGKKFLNNTIAPIYIALGDFNDDTGEDIFILDNGFSPSGYFIYSDGSEKELHLKNYPRLKLLNEKGIDINFDGSDDLVIINRNGELMSNIWKTESIPLTEKNIQDIIITSDNGIVYLTSISKTGEIGKHSIDPLTRTVLSTDFELPVFIGDYNRVYTLETSQGIIMSHDGDTSEIWLTPLVKKLISGTNQFENSQRIYYHEPDYVINLGEDFIHQIKWDTAAAFRNFTEEYIPKGMEFDLDAIQLNWKPKQNQLGYHQLSYLLELRKKGNLELDTDEGRKIVHQTEYEIQKNYSYLLYVNDPIEIKPVQDNLTIINGELFVWMIPIDDENADAHLDVKIIGGNKNAKINILPPEIILVPLDTESALLDIGADKPIIIEPETVVIDTALTVSEESTYKDTVKTEFEEFTEKKLEDEIDPFRKKKLEESDEDFKMKEEEYREKLKTHKKIVKNGKNVWIPIDSLNRLGDSIIVVDPAIEVVDSLPTPEKIADTTVVKGETLDTLIQLETIVEELLKDTNYLEIPYAELIAHQAQFAWHPQIEPGDYEFIITGTDGFTEDTSTFTLTVHPEIDLSKNQLKYNATVNKVFTTQVLLEQTPLSREFTYDLINAPENMRVDTLGYINWVPLPTQVDDYNFEIEVSDGIAATSLIYNIYVNAPPVISSRPPKIFFLHQREKMDFLLESFDLNSNANLEWKLISGPVDMTLSPEGSLVCTGSKLGHHPYEIQLNDGIDSVQWKGAIYVNSLPEITSEPITVITEGKRFEYTLTAWDANSISPYDSLLKNEIIFSLSKWPEGLNIDENNVLNWETSEIPLGEYMVTVVASDGVDDDIQVFPIFINSFPTITSLDSIIIQVGDTLNFQMEAIDKNLMDTLTFHLDPLLGNMVMELHSGVLTWTPGKKDLGVHTFNLQVKDGHDLNGTVMPFKIFVYDLPYLTVDLSTEAFTDMEYTAFITAKDMNGKKMDTPESIVIDTASFNYYNLSQYAHLFKWTPREVDKGNHNLVIKLTDDFGFTTFHHHNLTVFSNPCIHCDKENKTAPADTSRN